MLSWFNRYFWLTAVIFKISLVLTWWSKTKNIEHKSLNSLVKNLKIQEKRTNLVLTLKSLKYPFLGHGGILHWKQPPSLSGFAPIRGSCWNFNIKTSNISKKINCINTYRGKNYNTFIHLCSFHWETFFSELK